MKRITIEEVKELPKDSYQLIDIRDAESIAHGAIPGAIAAPQEDILSCEEVAPSKKLVICCSRGKFSVEAADKLREKGIDAVSLEGGYVAWLMDFMSAPEEKDVAAENKACVRSLRKQSGPNLPKRSTHMSLSNREIG